MDSKDIPQGGPASPDLARSLKLRRQELGLSLRTLARRSRCSASFLSMIEQGRISPSVRSLKRVCEGLGATLSDVVRPAEPAPEPIVVRRKDARGAVIMRWEKALARLLLPPEINCQFTLMLIAVKPGGQTTLRVSPRPLPEVHLVLRGRPTLMVNGAAIELSAGDCVYFDLTRPHKVVNHARSTAEVLIINASQFHFINDLEGNPREGLGGAGAAQGPREE